ncbi:MULTISPECIES: FG-GAP repeat protein [unclassified Streptomyces]|uniref:FG-GAP repeat protein n=1 Tax=unclassified Streptomyces TaxID=2593676 RepID=UPI002E19ADC5
MPNRIRRRSAVSCAALVALLTAPVVLAAPASATTTTPPVIDFNGDGFADLAISAPNATVSGVGDAGYLPPKDQAITWKAPHLRANAKIGHTVSECPLESVAFPREGEVEIRRLVRVHHAEP